MPGRHLQRSFFFAKTRLNEATPKTRPDEATPKTRLDEAAPKTRLDEATGARNGEGIFLLEQSPQVIQIEARERILLRVEDASGQATLGRLQLLDLLLDRVDGDELVHVHG